MKTEQLKDILEKIKSVRIAVVGDFCLDAYWFIDESKSEISIETGLMTKPVYQQKYSLGGAGNVTSNLAAMGVKDVRVFGVIGTDPFGESMISLMKKEGIITSNLLVQENNWSTHVYIKPCIGDAEQSRIDFGNFNILSEKTADKLINNLSEEIGGVDIIIVNQQVMSGIHTEYFRKKLVKLIGLFPEKIFITDSRNYNDYFTGSYRKMNDIEAVSLCSGKKESAGIVPYADVQNAAKTLFDRYDKPIFITRGDNGSIVVDKKGVVDIPGLMIISRIDTVGAGDSYLAGVASTLAAGYDLASAAETGTLVAGVTIQKLFQTGTATPEEILLIGTDPDYIYKPDIADNIYQAKYYGDTEIEIISKLQENFKIRHAIFDHDGTISTLREGWEKIMTPMMLKSILGENYFSTDEKTYKVVQKLVDELIDKTTGLQTLMQMKKLAALVRDFGIVPEKDILNESGYKTIYDEELLRLVTSRETKVIKGELSLDDFIIKNVITLLKELHKAGVKLYLVSGTDVEEVRNEAHFLGYDYLFEGGIYGAVGDIKKEAKRIVLDNILDKIKKSSGEQIVTFGDGPVEIRETKKRGGITIGVASDEKKRYGLNVRKRARLIKAGADIIIPDYSRMHQLLKLLNIK